MIPIINLSKIRKGDPGEMVNLHAACSNWGLFYLNNTAISHATIAGIFNRSKQFFELPSDKKQGLGIRNSKNFSGYVQLGEETTNNQPDLKESLEFAQEGVPPEDGNALLFQALYGANQWPDESWIPGFQSDVRAYHRQVEALGHEVMTSLTQSLGIPLENRAAYYHQPLHYRTRLMYYECMKILPADELRIHPHTDMALFNILLLDKPGLEVQNAEGEWHPVAPRQGAFVVILGELTHIWTNELYRAAIHRVRNSEAAEQRLSVPFFFYPNLLAPVKSMAVSAETGAPSSEPVLVGEMLWNRLNAVH